MTAAFAYGSAVFTQQGYSEAQQRAAMMDLVFVVEDADSWHAANLQRHATHYSSAGRWLGARGLLSWVQNEIGAGMYYNQCDFGGRRLKYGVITQAVLADDLCEWNSLYVSGRLHKPVEPLQPWPDDIERMVSSNRRAALDASLLLLPERFSEDELWETLCGLSYAGDVRMGFGESHAKPIGIAGHQAALLATLYAEPLSKARLRPACGEGASRMQDASLAARIHRLTALPTNAQRTLLAELHGGMAQPGSGTSSALDAAARRLWWSAGSDAEANRRLAAALRTALSRVVRASSLAQTIKGIASAGVGTSINYAIGKIRKRRLTDEHMAKKRSWG